MSDGPPTPAGSTGSPEGLSPPALSLRKKLLFTAIMFAGALLLIEIVLRVAWERPPQTVGERLIDLGLFREDPDLGWRMAPDVDVEQTFYGSHACRIRTNSRGFRDIEHPTPLPEGETRVVVLGDSFPWGYGVDAEQAFPSLLRTHLPGVRVINLGVSGYNVVQSHRMFELTGAAYRPDVVVFAFCQNDVTPRVVPKKAAVTREKPDRTWKQWCQENWYLYDFARTKVSSSAVLSRALRRIGLKDPAGGVESLDPNVRPSLKEYPESLQRHWDGTMAEIAALAKSVEAAGSRLIILEIPAKQQVERDSLERTLSYVEVDASDIDVRKPHDNLHAACKEAGAEFIGLLDPFLAHSGALYLEWDMHFNADGHRLAAQILAPRIRSMLSR